MITVEKIGGTSMSQFGEVLKNIMLRDPKNVYGRVYVVSAYSGVTNELLEHKKTGAPGIYAKFAQGDNYGAAMDALLGEAEGDQQGDAAARARPREGGRLPREAAPRAQGLPRLDAPRPRERVPRAATTSSSPRARCSPPSARRTARSTRSRS